ncbi:MAG: hypothetical protein SGPRY_006932 [Prymnesium sp.]
MEFLADRHRPLLDVDGSRAASAASLRRWKLITTTLSCALAVFTVLTAGLVYDRSSLLTQLQQQEKSVVSHPAGVVAAPAVIATACTGAGMDVFSNDGGSALPCCDGLELVDVPCREGAGNACTPAGKDVADNAGHTPRQCCPGLYKAETPCRGEDKCTFCQPPEVLKCTPPGTDIYANAAGAKQPCCPGLVQTTDRCRGTDVCSFCVPSTYSETPRTDTHAVKVSIDPATPPEAVDKHKHKGMSLIWSDEFKDLARTKSMFVFEDIPYGVPGNTGDVNIVSIYASDTVSLLPGGGLRLSAYMDPADEAIFMQGWNGSWNTNYGSDVSKWSWRAPKVTSRLNGRFQYGLIETRIKAPKGYGNWPAAWLNGCYGFVSEASGEFLLQDDYPFLCGQYWPPELDFFEHFSPEHTWAWRPNSMSLHSPNQYVGLGKHRTPQGGFCPTTLAPPGEAWCFGVSGSGSFKSDPTERYIDYAMKWDPDGVDYYMDDVFMHRFTTEQLVLYLSGQNRPIMIPEMPLFMTYNIALVRKGMDLSHMGEGLTDHSNFHPKTGKWKEMAMDVSYLRVYQDDMQGATRGLNPPITYETKRKMLANKVTCNLVPELRCMVKNSGDEANTLSLAKTACDKLKAFGDDYCDYIDKLCALNNAGNREGVYGMTNLSVAQFANQRLSLNFGVCCVEEDKSGLESKAKALLAKDRPICRDTPNTKLPQWLLDSEYYQDPKLMYAKEGKGEGLAGTNPASWKTYGMGLPSPPSPPA